MRSVQVLAYLGVGTGAIAAGLLGALQRPLSAAFTRDAAAAVLLAQLWPLLCALQPINAVVFGAPAPPRPRATVTTPPPPRPPTRPRLPPTVYDGLLYATRSFSFVRNALALGVFLVYAPALAAAKLCAPHSLVAIWAAKAALNGWRCAAALFRIHVQLWPRWGPRPPPADVPTSPLNAGGPAV